MSSVACAVRCRGCALEQLADGEQHERQDHALGLGEFERPLDRRLGAAPVAELLAGQGIQQRRVDRRPARLDRPLPALDRPAPARRPPARGAPSARWSAASAMRTPCDGRAPRRPSRRASARAAASSPRQACICTIRLRRSPLKACSPTSSVCIRFGRLEGGERLVEVAPRHRQQPVAWWTHQLRAGLALGAGPRGAPARASARPRRTSRARAGSSPPCPGAAAFTGSSVHPWSRAIATACSQSSSATEAGCPTQRGRHREMAEAAELQVRPSDAPRELEPLLQVAARVAGPGRPQLRDPEVHERGGAQVVAQRQLARRLRGQRCLHRPHRSPATVARSPRRRASASPASASWRSKRRRRSAGTASARRRAAAMYVRALVEQTLGEPGLREDERELRVACRPRPSGKAASSARSVAMRPSKTRLTVASASMRAASGQSPAACAWRIASTMSPCSSYHSAAARCSGADGRRREPPQLEPQQVGEQVVVAEPGPAGVDRDDERVRVLELLQDRAPSPSRR